MIKEVNDENFEKEVLKNERPVLVDFWAPWCGPCLMMTPIIEQLAQELKGKIDFAKVNVQENQEFASKYKVMSIPNLIIFDKGKVIEQMIGVQSAEILKTKLSSLED